jgi:hypothetical protein
LVSSKNKPRILTWKKEVVPLLVERGERGYLTDPKASNLNPYTYLSVEMKGQNEYTLIWADRFALSQRPSILLYTSPHFGRQTCPFSTLPKVPQVFSHLVQIAQTNTFTLKYDIPTV